MPINILSQNGQMVRKPTLTAAFTDADTAGKTVVITGPVTASTMDTGGRSLEIKQGGVITIPTGATLTINGPFSCGLYQCFDGAGSVVFGSGSVTEVYPEWWGGSITKAINSMPDGGTVILQRKTYVSEYTSPSAMMTTNGIILAGAGMPAKSDDNTKLENGTIIKGPFIVNAHFFQAHDLGFDSGSAVCTELFGGVAKDSLMMPNVMYAIVAPFKNPILKNVATIGQSSTAAIHGILLENVANAATYNTKTYLSQYGLVLKGSGNIQAHHGTSHQMGPLTIKSEGYAICKDVTVGSVTIESIANGDTGPVLVLAQSASMSNIQIGSIKAKGVVTTALSIKAENLVAAEDISIGSIIVPQSTSYAVGISHGGTGGVTRVNIGNCIINNAGGGGIVSTVNTSYINVAQCQLTNITGDGVTFAGDHSSIDNASINTSSGYGITSASATNKHNNVSGATNILGLVGGTWESTPVAVTFANLWANYGATTDPCTTITDGKTARLTGTIKSGTVGAMVFVLPSALIPPKDLRFPIITNSGIGEALVSSSDGGVYIVSGGNTYVSLSGISWPIFNR